MIYTVYNRHSPVGMNTLFIHTSIVPHSTEGVFDLCNIADLLIYSLLVKSMTTFIIFIFFMISIPFAPNDTYSPFLVDFPFFTIQGTCRPAVNNIPIENSLYRCTFLTKIKLYLILQKRSHRTLSFFYMTFFHPYQFFYFHYPLD